jgi:hypothetical protein
VEKIGSRTHPCPVQLEKEVDNDSDNESDVETE